MKQLGILLPQHYRLLSVAAILDVFESVNSMFQTEGRPVPFSIRLISDEPADSFGSYPTVPVDGAIDFDLLLIPAFASKDFPRVLSDNGKYIPWLRQQYEMETEIATFCTGAFLLGATGLLSGRLATTHVDASGAFKAAFPLVKLAEDKVVVGDSGLFTSGGATSTFHLLLHLIGRFCGNDVAIRVAKLFAIDMDRGNQSYFSTFLPRRDHKDEIVAMTQDKIEAAYHRPFTIEEMIRDVPSSRRNIARRFKQATGITPIEYLQKTRIEAAKRLLEQTNQQMTEIMLNAGYNDPKAFRKIFRKTVGMTPTSYRAKFQTP